MADSGRAIKALCQECGQWREAVNRETEWTCRECHLEAQGQRLLALVETREKELAEARRERDALQASLLKARREIEDAWTQAACYCRKVIQTREVARWLLQEWAGPENWADAIAEAEAKFGMLDWLRKEEA